MRISGKSLLAVFLWCLICTLNSLAQTNNTPLPVVSYELNKNERTALNSLKSIVAAQNSFLINEGVGKNYAALNQLAASGLIDSALSAGTKDGYLFFVSTKSADKNAPPSFEAGALPLIHGKTGRKSFFYKNADAIRFADRANKPAAADDPPFDEQSEADAIAAVKAVIAAQNIYLSAYGTNIKYGTLEQLGEKKLIDPFLATGDRHGYSFGLNTQEKTDEKDAAFQLFAVPIGVNTGLRAFFANQSGSIHYRQKIGEVATAQDPILDDPSETDAISVMRYLMSAQTTYLGTIGQNRRYGTFAELFESNLLDKTFSKSVRWGYRYYVAVPPAQFNEYQIKFQVYAVPLVYSQTTKRSFYGDETGIIRAADKKGMAATAADPPLR